MNQAGIILLPEIAIQKQSLKIIGEVWRRSRKKGSGSEYLYEWRQNQQ
jgi:hypothetical protein